MDIVTYALAKTYTDKSLLGGGAIKGKNCTIEDIEAITGGHRITFKWTLDDDTEQTGTLDVMDGDEGPQGEQGPAGADGQDGADGNGVKSAYISNNHLFLILDDNTEVDAGDIGTAAVLTQSLTSTISVGGIEQGKTYNTNTHLENIINDLLAPDNKINLCPTTSYDWTVETDILSSYYYDANCMLATTVFDGHPAPLRTVDNIIYYPLKIKNNINTVIITPATNSNIVVNVGIADGNTYKRASEYGTGTQWKTSSTTIDVSALRATYGVDDIYIIGKVAKSDWGIISPEDLESLKATITYVSSISPNVPPVPATQGAYLLECDVNNSGNSQLSWGSKKPSYSTTEQIVATWIDGRPVYELTIDFGAGLASGTKKVNMSIEGTVDKFISIYSMDNNTNDSCIPIPCPGGSNNKIVIDRPSGSNPYYTIGVLGSYNMTNCYIYLVLRYIKVVT